MLCSLTNVVGLPPCVLELVADGPHPDVDAAGGGHLLRLPLVNVERQAPREERGAGRRAEPARIIVGQRVRRAALGRLQQGGGVRWRAGGVMMSACGWLRACVHLDWQTALPLT